MPELNKAADPAALGEYFSTHPSAEVRITSIRRFLQHRLEAGA